MAKFRIGSLGMTTRKRWQRSLGMPSFSGTRSRVVKECVCVCFERRAWCAVDGPIYCFIARHIRPRLSNHPLFHSQLCREFGWNVLSLPSVFYRIQTAFKKKTHVLCSPSDLPWRTQIGIEARPGQKADIWGTVSVTFKLCGWILKKHAHTDPNLGMPKDCPVSQSIALNRELCLERPSSIAMFT